MLFCVFNHCSFGLYGKRASRNFSHVYPSLYSTRDTICFTTDDVLFEYNICSILLCSCLFSM